MSATGRQVTAGSRIDTSMKVGQPDHQVGRHPMEAA
jgi:hypothetical protein